MMVAQLPGSSSPQKRMENPWNEQATLDDGARGLHPSVAAVKSPFRDEKLEYNLSVTSVAALLPVLLWRDRQNSLGRSKHPKPGARLEPATMPCVAGLYQERAAAASKSILLGRDGNGAPRKRRPRPDVESSRQTFNPGLVDRQECSGHEENEYVWFRSTATTKKPSARVERVNPCCFLANVQVNIIQDNPRCHGNMNHPSYRLQRRGFTLEDQDQSSGDETGPHPLLHKVHSLCHSVVPVNPMRIKRKGPRRRGRRGQPDRPTGLPGVVKERLRWESAGNTTHVILQNVVAQQQLAAQTLCMPSPGGSAGTRACLPCVSRGGQAKPERLASLDPSSAGLLMDATLVANVSTASASPLSPRRPRFIAGSDLIDHPVSLGSKLDLPPVSPLRKSLSISSDLDSTSAVADGKGPTQAALGEIPASPFGDKPPQAPARRSGPDSISTGSSGSLKRSPLKSLQGSTRLLPLCPLEVSPTGAGVKVLSLDLSRTQESVDWSRGNLPLPSSAVDRPRENHTVASLNLPSPPLTSEVSKKPLRPPRRSTLTHVPIPHRDDTSQQKRLEKPRCYARRSSLTHVPCTTGLESSREVLKPASSQSKKWEQRPCRSTTTGDGPGQGLSRRSSLTHVPPGTGFDVLKLQTTMSTPNSIKEWPKTSSRILLDVPRNFEHCEQTSPLVREGQQRRRFSLSHVPVPSSIPSPVFSPMSSSSGSRRNSRRRRLSLAQVDLPLSPSFSPRTQGMTHRRSSLARRTFRDGSPPPVKSSRLPGRRFSLPHIPVSDGSQPLNLKRALPEVRQRRRSSMTILSGKGTDVANTVDPVYTPRSRRTKVNEGKLNIAEASPGKSDRSPLRTTSSQTLNFQDQCLSSARIQRRRASMTDACLTTMHGPATPSQGRSRLPAVGFEDKEPPSPRTRSLDLDYEGVSSRHGSRQDRLEDPSTLRSSPPVGSVKQSQEQESLAPFSFRNGCRVSEDHVPARSEVSNEAMSSATSLREEQGEASISGHRGRGGLALPAKKSPTSVRTNYMDLHALLGEALSECAELDTYYQNVPTSQGPEVRFFAEPATVNSGSATLIDSSAIAPRPDQPAMPPIRRRSTRRIEHAAVDVPCKVRRSGHSVNDSNDHSSRSSHTFGDSDNSFADVACSFDDSSYSSSDGINMRLYDDNSSDLDSDFHHRMPKSSSPRSGGKKNLSYISDHSNGSLGSFAMTGRSGASLGDCFPTSDEEDFLPTSDDEDEYDSYDNFGPSDVEMSLRSEEDE
jgi:hypothetical protein